MRAHPKLTDQQHAKVIAMASEGATHAEIVALLHVPLGTIRTVLTAWIKDNLPELQKNLRAFIDANLANGKQSMMLPKVSRLVSRPVLAEYAKHYTITTRERLACTWHLFTTATHVSAVRNRGNGMAIEQLVYAKRGEAEAAAYAAGLCTKCLKRPHGKRSYKCAQCIAWIRASNASQSCE